MFNNKKITLTDAQGAQNEVVVNASLVASKSDASKYFGTWFKNEATPADVVSWATNLIAQREREISNLKALKSASQEAMVEGMDAATLRSILQKLEQAA